MADNKQGAAAANNNAANAKKPKKAKVPAAAPSGFPAKNDDASGVYKKKKS